MTVAVLEMTRYRVDVGRVAEYLQERPSIDVALREFPGVRSVASAQLGPAEFVDVVLWDDHDAAEQAQKQAAGDPRLAPLFTWLEDVTMEFGEVVA